MNSAELLKSLAETAIASTIALLMILLLRRPMRTWFGARVAYSLWCGVPVAMVAVLLPAMRAVAPEPVVAFVRAVAPGDGSSVVAAVETSDRTAWLLAIWVVGACVMGLWFLWQQLAFQRGLGRLRVRNDGLYQARSVAGLPAAIGVWKPRIVVPADFDQRYFADERLLLREHERAHIRHGDLQCNALVALLRCLFWFNPLLHYAARHFRHDQELACDQRVIARHPQVRRRYGEAMLKTQLAAQPLPLGCHWGFSHPLKERIAMLGQPVPSRRRWLAGSLCVFTLLVGSGVTAWAAQPGETAAPDVPAGNIQVTAVLRIDGGAPQTTRLVRRPGDPILINYVHDGHLWMVSAKTSKGTPSGLLSFAATITRDGKQVATPTIAMRSGIPGTIQIGEDRSAVGGTFSGIELVVTLADSETPAAVVKPGIRFDVAITKDGKAIPMPSSMAPFGEEVVIEIPGSVRIEASAMPPAGDISRVAARMYYYRNNAWVLDFDTFMDANIGLTPSFDKTLGDGQHRVVLMPRRIE